MLFSSNCFQSSTNVICKLDTILMPHQRPLVVLIFYYVKDTQNLHRMQPLPTLHHIHVLWFNFNTH